MLKFYLIFLKIKNINFENFPIGTNWYQGYNLRYPTVYLKKRLNLMVLIEACLKITNPDT